jgi:alpha-tubulin suppressor-like RCC1 family protein
VAVGGIPAGARVIEIRGGGLHTIARLDDGRIVAWGLDSYGQMSHGLSSEPRGAVALPASVTGGGTAVALAAGCALSCVATSAGTLCGGSNLADEIGGGVVDPVLRYNRLGMVTASSGALSMIAAGGKDFVAPMRIRQHVCGVAGTQLVCWGNNSRAQLGPVATMGTSSEFPSQVLFSFPSPITAVAAGAAHSCVRAGGGIYCWGSNGSDESVNSADNMVMAGTTVTTPTRVRIP